MERVASMQFVLTRRGPDTSLSIRRRLDTLFDRQEAQFDAARGIDTIQFILMQHSPDTSLLIGHRLDTLID